MRSLSVILAILLFSSCGKNTGTSSTPRPDLDRDKITDVLFRDATAWRNSTGGDNAEEEHYFSITKEQFHSLAHERASELKELARESHGYDYFEARVTDLTPTSSTFTAKLGIGTKVYWVVHGVHTSLPGAEPNTVISVARTHGGEQDGACQPATAVDSKSEGIENTKPESEKRSQ